MMEATDEVSGQQSGDGTAEYQQQTPFSSAIEDSEITGANEESPPVQVSLLNDDKEESKPPPVSPVEAMIPDDNDDEADADVEESEIDEVFEDEPPETMSNQKSPKSRPRTKVVAKLFSGKKATPNKKSYWSSDDEQSTPDRKKALARNKKSRNKRRQRRSQAELDDGSSTSNDDIFMETPNQISKRPQESHIPIVNEGLNDSRSRGLNSEKPPPVAIIRTKPMATPKPAINGKNSPTVSFQTSPDPADQTATTDATGATPRTRNTLTPSLHQLSLEDLEICQRLDDEYEHALEEREVGYMARYTSVRQSACLSVVFMLIFLSLGTTFFMRYANWSIHDSLLFSIYTITTVGYGSVGYGDQSIPKEMGFQTFTILYIFVGIAILTIMVAQVYQCIALEASRAQHSRDKTEMARRGLDLSRRNYTRASTRTPGGPTESVQSSAASANSGSVTHDPTIFLEDFACFESVVRYYENAKHFFTYNEYGRSFSVLLPFAGLILIGAIVVGPIEGWNMVESLYFAIVSLTTVGFGDYYPRHVASIWFCILWLPFSVGFMSMFLKNVATFYIRLSAQNINRIERRMRRRLARAKEAFEREREEALKRAYHGQSLVGTELELRQFRPGDSGGPGTTQTNSNSKQPSLKDKQLLAQHTEHHSGPAAGRRRRHKNFDALPTTPEASDSHSPPIAASRASLFGSPGEEAGVLNRRERILKNSLSENSDTNRPTGQTMETMKDILRAVHKSMDSGESKSKYLSIRSSVMKMPIGPGHAGDGPIRKPSFALRALVQERFAEIIATDIAGFPSSIEIKDNTLSVTIDSMKETAERWCIPRRARKAFRAVAFEALYFVGEHGLITKGADALFALTPIEFHGLFSPLLAAMGDADTMEAWLTDTDTMAKYDLHQNDDADGKAGKGSANIKHLNDVEMGGSGTTAKEQSPQRPTTVEKLHTATHRTRKDSSMSLQPVSAMDHL